MSNSQLNILKPGIKSNTEVILKVSSKVVGVFNGENNFLHTLLLTNTHVSSFVKLLQTVPELI